MSSIITNQDALDRLREMDAAITAGATAVKASEAELAELTARSERLASTMADHEATRPEPDPKVADVLSDLLVADPSQAMAPHWIERVGKLQASTLTALASWEATRAILMRTAAKIADESRAVTERLQVERETNEAAFISFLNHARGAILDELEARWDGLIAELLGPLAAMFKARKLHGVGIHQLGMFHAIDPESKLTILHRDPASPTGTGRRRLFPIDAHQGGEATIAKFRAQLAAPAVAPATRPGRRAS